MCVAITQMREESKAEGRAEGVELGILETIRNIMASLKVTKERAVEIAGVPDSQKELYLQKL